MSRPARILVLGAQVPFASGGAEALVGSLDRELRHRGFASEIVQLPFSWAPRQRLLESALAWRLLDLTRVGEEPIDLVIATRFPTYTVRHPNKVVWLVHQFRQVYDLAGTRFSDFGASSVDRATADLVRRIDRRSLGEARRLFTISGNTAHRLRHHLDLEATPLYPPSPLSGRLRPGPAGEYVLSVGRLDELKRTDLLIQALRHTAVPVRAIVVGSGPQEQQLRDLAQREGVAERVELLGRVDDDRLVELYAGCRGVVYTPYDEDYGYVTLEALEATKPVITVADAGGVLEFVSDGVNGLVVAPEPRPLAAAIDRLGTEPELAARLGAAGSRQLERVDWDRTIAALTASL